jgi:SAM-dependent methyltransferase
MSRRGLVTGERVVTSAGGFNPTWQRHVAAYALCEPFLPSGRVVDLGCGVGHSYDRLAPRETVGVDLSADALAGQERETVVADMRRLPFADGEFDGAIAVQSIEHVPDPERAVAETARVLGDEGTAVFVTPNRLTFARADEIIDPYHHIEYDPQQLRDAVDPFFAAVEIHGIFGSERYGEIVAEQLHRLDRLLRLDPLRLRRLLPRRARQRLYDRRLSRERREQDPRAAAIGVEDFALRSEGVEAALDVVAVCRAPLARRPPRV